MRKEKPMYTMPDTTPTIRVGSYVHVQRQSSKPQLRVVIAVKHDPLRYGVAWDGHTGWIEPAAIVDPAPACLTCGSSRFWVEPDAPRLYCAQCVPPRLNWNRLLRDLGRHTRLLE